MCAKKTGKTLPKYETHVAPRMDEIKTMFENGARMKDVAQALGVSPRSMFRYANDHPRLRELIEEAKKPADDCVEYAFYRTATGFHYKEKKIDKVCHVILHIGTKVNKNLKNTILALNGLKCHLRIVGKLSEEYVKMLLENNIDYSSCANISDEELLEEYYK